MVTDPPTLGKHGRDEAEIAEGEDPQASEDSQSFFHVFFEGQINSISYPVLIDKATKIFKPEAFIERARTAAAAEFANGLQTNAEEIRAMAADVARDGLESVLRRAAQRLRDSDRVLTHDAVNKFFADDPDYARLIDLANGCEIPEHADFVPFWRWGDHAREQ